MGAIGPPLQACGWSGRHPRGRGNTSGGFDLTGSASHRSRPSCVVPTLRPDLARAWPKACAVTGGFCSAPTRSIPLHQHTGHLVSVAPRYGHRHHRRDRLHRLSVLRHGRVPRGRLWSKRRWGRSSASVPLPGARGVATVEGACNLISSRLWHSVAPRVTAVRVSATWPLSTFTLQLYLSRRPAAGRSRRRLLRRAG